MAAIADVLIPAGAVVIGGLITGGFTLGGQILAHRGSLKRERVARRDAFMVRRYEIERDTLIVLQDTLLEHFNIYMDLARQVPRPGSSEPPTRLDLLGLLGKVNLLTRRVLDDDAKKYTDQYMSTARQALPEVMALRKDSHDPAEVSTATHALVRPVEVAFVKAQSKIGAAVRRDPFEGGPVNSTAKPS